MLNLKHLARYRVHIIFSAFLLAWFALVTFARVIDGENVLWAFWASIKEVKLMEWASIVCLWVSIATVTKQNAELRAKIELLESRL